MTQALVQLRCLGLIWTLRLLQTGLCDKMAPPLRTIQRYPEAVRYAVHRLSIWVYRNATGCARDEGSLAFILSTETNAMSAKLRYIILVTRLNTLL